VVEQGERVAARIEFRREETGLPDGVNRLETRLAEEFLTLRLTPEAGGETVEIRPDDPLLGMPPDPPEPGEAPENLAGEIPPVRAVFPLVGARDRLPPGRYRAEVRFSFPGPPGRRRIFEEEDARLWEGTLVSGPLLLDIVAEPRRTRTIRVPTRLRLSKGLELTYSAEDSEVVSIPHGNGFFLGTIAEGDGGDARFGVVSGGPPTPGDSLYVLSAAAGKPFAGKVTITVFRTTGPPGHDWALAFETETLWKRTYDLSFTAEEIEANR